MKILTKNYSLKNGKRSYLVYLTDENNNPLECYDVVGNEERLKKEEEISERFDVSDEDMTYISLEKFKEQEDPVDKPLFLVFYLDSELFTNQSLVAAYGENVKKYLEEKGDNVRLFFMPAKDEEKIVCINPLYIEDEAEFTKIDPLVKELEHKLSMEGSKVES